MKCSALAGSLLILGDLVGAVRLGVNGVSSLHRRGNLQGIGNTTLTNTADVQYQTKVTIGGRDYLVLIDTGRYVVSKYHRRSKAQDLE
jgi:hypothetical protein